MKRLTARIVRLAAFTLFFLAIGLFGAARADANALQRPPAPNNVAIAPVVTGCLVSGPAVLVCGGVAVAAVLCYMYCQDVFDTLFGGSMMAEHTKGARGSTKDKHEKGNARRQRDQKRKEERKRRGDGR